MARKIFLVAGIGYGDEGKGVTVDHLVRKHKIKNVVRYNGGWQAAHFVTDINGAVHCCSQFGAGIFVPGVRTFLSRYMLFNPFALELENKALMKLGIRDALDRLYVDNKCPIVTPANILINRMLEISRGAQRHGSCGKGIGQTAADQRMYGNNVLMVEDLADEKITRRKLEYFWRMRIDLAEQIAGQYPKNLELQYYLQRLQYLDIAAFVQHYKAVYDKLRVCDEHVLSAVVREEGAVFEGAQGALLDTEYGFYPYVTSTTTTFANAFEIIERSGFVGQVVKIGVTRAYATRHGAGPFVTENKELANRLPACHNTKNEWQGNFRIGWLDFVAMKYGIAILGGIDELFLTNIDRLSGLKRLNVCYSYSRLPQSHFGETEKWFDVTQNSCNQPQCITGIKPIRKPSDECRNQVSDILQECHPNYYACDGWRFEGGAILPREIKDYISLIEQSLDAQITTVSVGPAARHKIELIKQKAS